MKIRPSKYTPLSLQRYEKKFGKKIVSQNLKKNCDQKKNQVDFVSCESNKFVYGIILIFVCVCVCVVLSVVPTCGKKLCTHKKFQKVMVNL